MRMAVRVCMFVRGAHRGGGLPWAVCCTSSLVVAAAPPLPRRISSVVVSIAAKACAPPPSCTFDVLHMWRGGGRSRWHACPPRPRAFDDGVVCASHIHERSMPRACKRACIYYESIFPGDSSLSLESGPVSADTVCCAALSLRIELAPHTQSA